MHRILLLDDKSLTWHAVTGQPRATAPASDSWGGGGATVLIGQRRYCFSSRAARAGYGRIEREQV